MAAWFSTLRKRAFLKTSLAEQQEKAAMSGAPLRQCLGPWDVLFLGIGGTIGSGLFVVTGVAAAEHAGPSVIVSYVLAALAALLSGLCYTQLVVDMPVAGGATFYMANIFGELVSWIVAANLIMEYSLSVAAVGRSASGYFATLLGTVWRKMVLPDAAGLPPTFFLLPAGGIRFDFFSLALVLLLSALLVYGTEASNTFNIVVTGMNLLVIAYVLCVGFPFGRVENLSPFAPFGIHGTFDAAAIVFFSFVGFDAAATAAEEVHEPKRDMPVGIVGAILVSAVLYVLMCLCICLMLPYSAIDLEAPFAAAFTSLATPGSSALHRTLLATSARFVSFGALTGIVTSLLVSILGQARIYAVLGRAGLLPRCLAQIHPIRNTPANATLLTGVSSGLLACVVDLDTLAELVSIGTLFVFFMVACGVLWQRYSTGDSRDIRAGGVLAVNVLVAFGISTTYIFGGPIYLLGLFAGLWVLSTGALALLPVAYLPQKFAVPLSPLVPALGMLLTLLLICSLGWKAYVRFGVWLLLSVLFYAVYGSHNAAKATLSALQEQSAEAAPLRTEADSAGVQLMPCQGEDGGPAVGESEQIVEPNSRILNATSSDSSCGADSGTHC